MNIIKDLDHPNIFTIYEFFKDKENFYMISEYLEGGELFEYISNSKKMDEQTTFLIMEQIISAVHYLHKHNIVHRDLKPENLLLSKKNDPSNIKLIDFGTSIKFHQGDVFNIPLGTCYYLAPEVIRRQYDEKADIWSCGIIMYILLAGYPPFNGENDLQIFKAILKQPIIFDQKDWQYTSSEVKDLVSKMLEKIPIDRISLDKVVKHIWFDKNFVRSFNNFDNSVKILSKIKEFTIQSKLEKALRTFLVQHLDLSA